MSQKYPTCEDPNAPEYEKCYKKENNSGCSCSCAQANSSIETTTEETETIIRARNTRDDFSS